MYVAEPRYDPHPGSPRPLERRGCRVGLAPGARMSGRWFRFYDGVLDDPKVQCLPAELFQFWVNMLCVSSKFDGNIPDARHLSFSLKMQERKVNRLLGELLSAGLIDKTDQGLTPHNWQGRQYKSDVSTSRVKRFRERFSNGVETPSEAEDRIQKQNTEQKDKIPRQARKTKLPDDWQPSEELLAYAAEQGCVDPKDTAERFRLHHQSKGTLGANWDRGFQFWCRNEKNFKRPAADQRRFNAPVSTAEEPWEQRHKAFREHGFWLPMWGPKPKLEAA